MCQHTDEVSITRVVPAQTWGTSEHAVRAEVHTGLQQWLRQRGRHLQGAPVHTVEMLPSTQQVRITARAALVPAEITPTATPTATPAAVSTVSTALAALPATTAADASTASSAPWGISR
ncbi:hypothetical protein [Kineococcus sp. SYSU DK005]|uniref:hypothetical protein n=1 Tax=Kineococcus sp. SYSU DK005 TaxID=3383126 RepID=UPI003D7C4CAB